MNPALSTLSIGFMFMLGVVVFAPWYLGILAIFGYLMVGTQLNKVGLTSEGFLGRRDS